MSMAGTAPKVEDLTLSITDEIHVNAPLEVTFDALIEQLSEGMVQGDEKPMPMKIEQWPGGRWWRDLGDGKGTSGRTCSRLSGRCCWNFAGR